MTAGPGAYSFGSRGATLALSATLHAVLVSPRPRGSVRSSSWRRASTSTGS
jgi:hypothetical protein